MIDLPIAFAINAFYNSAPYFSGLGIHLRR
jgi:hypothetical protein